MLKKLDIHIPKKKKSTLKLVEDKNRKSLETFLGEPWLGMAQINLRKDNGIKIRKCLLCDKSHWRIQTQETGWKIVIATHGAHKGLIAGTLKNS